MAYLCEECGAIFKGENASRDYEKHIEKHKFENTPAINDKKYIVEYEVTKAEFDDYSPIRLRDINNGNWFIDDAVRQLYNTNINISVVEKLIGKTIRITSYAEIIDE